MKAYDFEAVVYDGAVYCIDCCPVSAEDDNVMPIFADSEWDTAPVCDKCGAVHDYVTVLETESEEEADEDGFDPDAYEERKQMGLVDK